MKAASSDTSEDEVAEDEDLDYSDFFSVLLYYGLSKSEILNSSRPFLYAIYKRYGYRACENLGVSPDGHSEEGSNKTPLTESDYPIEFKKLSKMERKEALQEFSSTDDFMAQFGQSAKTPKSNASKNKLIEI